MELGERLLAVGAGERAASFELFSETLDAEWIAQALQATGTATIRRRKLPAEYVVRLVIGMGLLRDRSIREVVRHLDLVLPAGPRRVAVSGSAIVQARERLGPEPLAALFAQSAAVWGAAAVDAERWRGLAVYGVDGTTLRVPDTADNDAAFGRVPTRWESTGGYPLLRLVALMVLRRHVLTGLAIGAYRDSELALATALCRVCWEPSPGRRASRLPPRRTTDKRRDGGFGRVLRAKHTMHRVDGFGRVRASTSGGLGTSTGGEEFPLTPAPHL